MAGVRALTNCNFVISGNVHFGEKKYEEEGIFVIAMFGRKKLLVEKGAAFQLLNHQDSPTVPSVSWVEGVHVHEHHLDNKQEI
jgi:hypothetical protein